MLYSSHSVCSWQRCCGSTALAQLGITFTAATHCCDSCWWLWYGRWLSTTTISMTSAPSGAAAHSLCVPCRLSVWFVSQSAQFITWILISVSVGELLCWPRLLPLDWSSHGDF